MHDRTRIAVCRWTFLVLCAAPTCLVLAFIAAHWLTARSAAATAEWERELSQRLGVAVSIEGLSYPQPSVAELRGVTLADAETGLPLAQCGRIEIELKEGKWEVMLADPAVRQDAMGTLVEKLHDRVLISSASAKSVRLVAAELTIQDHAAAQSLVNLSANLESAATGPKLALRFSLPQQSRHIELHVTRNRQVAPPATQIEWNCPAPLPANLARSFSADVSALGPHAMLYGSGRLTLRADSFSGEFSGELAGIDLTSLVSQRFEHVLSGEGTLKLESASIAASRLSQARGTLVVAGGGRISRSLLTAAEEHLELTATLPAEETDSVAYRRLSLGFELTADHLRLTGVADASQTGIVMSAANGPLLSAPENHRVPAVALARTLVPDNQVQVPASQQTAALLRLLPLRASEPQTARRTWHTPTQLVPGSSAERADGVIREETLR